MLARWFLHKKGGYPEVTLCGRSLIGSQKLPCGSLVYSNYIEIPHTIRIPDYIGPSREVNGNLESPLGRFFI